MSHTIVAFQENIDPAAAYVNLTGVADETVKVSGDYIYVGNLDHLIGAMACIEGTADLGARLETPSLRANALYQIKPWANNLYPVTQQSLILFPDSPIPLVKGEGLSAMINSNPAAAAIQSVIAVLADGPITPTKGQMLSVCVSAAITETLGAWTSGALTFDQTLPKGRYALVGAAFYGTSGVAFRLIPVGAIHRPGGICLVNPEDEHPPLQRHGGLGVWCEFDSETPPSLEWLAYATSGTAQTGVLDLIRLS